MKCDRCREQLPAVDGIDQDGQTLCLECAMRGFSAVRACDPWVVQRAELSQFVIKKVVMKSHNTTGCVK